MTDLEVQLWSPKCRRKEGRSEALHSRISPVKNHSDAHIRREVACGYLVYTKDSEPKAHWHGLIRCTRRRWKRKLVWLDRPPLRHFEDVGRNQVSLGKKETDLTQPPGKKTKGNWGERKGEEKGPF